MKGDFTRDSFDAAKHYSRVMLQQGRVQLDADWNEQTAIVLHYLRTLAADILGPHAGPADHLGFEIITKESLAVEADPTNKLVSLGFAAETHSNLNAELADGDMIIGLGRYYVAGLLVENNAAILYSQQLGYPYFSKETQIENINSLKKNKANLLVYLDVWEQEVSYIEDAHIREVALGGPDTCTRAKVMWQVKVLNSPDSPVDRNSVDSLPALGAGKLRARARVDKPPVDLCSIPPEALYRGAENQLYRVEVHSGGTASNGATFKWSRENGSVVFPIRTLKGGIATLENLGRDLRLGLSEGDWVEILDDAITLGETAGQFAQVGKVDGDESSVALMSPVGAPLPGYTMADTHKHPFLRRWDHVGDLMELGGALPIKEGDDTKDMEIEKNWLTLEDGVQIRFSSIPPDTIYFAGQYWLIPTRTVTGDVEWPSERINGNIRMDASNNPIAAALAANGPIHAYAPLFILSAAQQVSHPDCRCRIESMKCT